MEYTISNGWDWLNWVTGDTTMNRFTTENTEGFSESQLNVLNSAFDKINSEVNGDNNEDYADKIRDTINNCWVEDISEKELLDSVRNAVEIL